ncbi:MAG: beta-ketoacyl synthase, partial [Saprospiraceae bacterium]|nr:beta-ketoacyl synthase [Saprospiraceae bacterium]
GAELSQAIGQALEQARWNAGEVDFISAHGTATPYNDEMEAKAFDLAGLSQTPLNSLKGYFGHTLGAAGLIESVVSVQSLRDNTVLPTRGYEQPGVSRPVEVCHQLLEGPLQRCLKTASGFGGCNAAVLFEKN